MDGIVIYAAVFWFVIALLQGIAHCKKEHGFIAWIIVQAMVLPIYGRIFEWW